MSVLSATQIRDVVESALGQGASIVMDGYRTQVEAWLPDGRLLVVEQQRSGALFGEESQSMVEEAQHRLRTFQPSYCDSRAKHDGDLFCADTIPALTNAARVMAAPVAHLTLSAAEAKHLLALLDIDDDQSTPDGVDLSFLVPRLRAAVQQASR